MRASFAEGRCLAISMVKKHNNTTQKLGLNFNLLRKDLERRKYNFYAIKEEQPIWGTYLLKSQGYLQRKPEND